MSAPIAPLTYDIEQAAERLGPVCTVAWLKKHIREIPHVKSGNGTGRAGRIAFTEAHLAEILVMLERRPSPAPTGPEAYSSGLGRRRRAS